MICFMFSNFLLFLCISVYISVFLKATPDILTTEQQDSQDDSPPCSRCSKVAARDPHSQAELNTELHKTHMVSSVLSKLCACVCVCVLACEQTSPPEAPRYAQNASMCVKQASCLPLRLSREGRMCPLPKGVNRVQCFGHVKLTEQLGSLCAAWFKDDWQRFCPPQPVQWFCIPHYTAVAGHFLTSDEVVNQTRMQMTTTRHRRTSTHFVVLKTPQCDLM